MCRPDLTLLPVPDAIKQLSIWLEPKMPAKLRHSHEKISDAELVAVALLRAIHKVPYFKSWWNLVKVNHYPHYPSLPQAVIRLTRLTPLIEQLSVQVERLDFVVIDSEPLPMCRFKRAPRCKFPRASYGHSSQGAVFGFKLHAWVTLNGKLVQYVIRPANQHDFTVGCELNQSWGEYGAPRIIGDKGYQSGSYLTPPKSNARRRARLQTALGPVLPKTPDPRWKEEYAAARKIIESTFSSLVGRGLRFGQVKTMLSLRLKVALTVLAHNLKFLNP